jgi:hypothetical protein
VLVGHPAHKSRHAVKAVRGSAYLRGHRSKADVRNELLECVDSPRSPCAPNDGLRSSGKYSPALVSDLCRLNPVLVSDSHLHPDRVAVNVLGSTANPPPLFILGREELKVETLSAVTSDSSCSGSSDCANPGSRAALKLYYKLKTKMETDANDLNCRLRCSRFAGTQPVARKALKHYFKLKTKKETAANVLNYTVQTKRTTHINVLNCLLPKTSCHDMENLPPSVHHPHVWRAMVVGDIDFLILQAELVLQLSRCVLAAAAKLGLVFINK